MIKQVDASHLVTPDNSFLIGHRPYKDEDFDTSLILSMVYQPNGEEHLHPTKTCVFYVGAKGPAMPVLRVFELNGARCSIETSTKEALFTVEAQ